jgi:hypothetical protein
MCCRVVVFKLAAPEDSLLGGGPLVQRVEYGKPGRAGVVRIELRHCSC